MRSAALLSFLALLPGVECGAAEVDAARLFAQLDVDRDGRVTAREVGADHARLFERLLRTSDDGDGQLTADELAAALTPVRAEKAAVAKQGSRLPGSDALVVIVARMDVNGDRQLVEDEIPQLFRAVFTRMRERADGNKDGRIDARELAEGGPQLGIIAQAAAARVGIDVQAELARLPAERRSSIEGMGAYANPREMLADLQQAAELFARLDANSDKHVSADEAPEGLANLIRRGDRDGDGMLSQPEWQTIASRLAAGSGAPNRPSATRRNVRQLLSRWDRNGDGSLSPAEAPPRMARGFERLDQDGDGVLNALELGRFSGQNAVPGRAPAGVQPDAGDEQMQ